MKFNYKIYVVHLMTFHFSFSSPIHPLCAFSSQLKLNSFSTVLWIFYARNQSKKKSEFRISTKLCIFQKYQNCTRDTHGQILSSSSLVLMKLKPESVIGFNRFEQSISSACPHGVFELKLSLQHFVIRTTAWVQERERRESTVKLWNF